MVPVPLKYWRFTILSTRRSGLGLGASQLATVRCDLRHQLVSCPELMVEMAFTHNSLFSEILTNSILELCWVGPRVHRMSSFSGSQQADVMSGRLQRPNRTLRRLRMVVDELGSLRWRDAVLEAQSAQVTFTHEGQARPIPVPDCPLLASGASGI